MNRQNTSKTLFGLIMLTVALLLAACGSGDGDATPTPTSEANAAVPTLPADEATAQTGEISEEDLTVVTPDLPAVTAATPGTVTPDGTVTVAGTPVGAERTPADTVTVVGTPVDLVASSPAVQSQAPATSPIAATPPAPDATVTSSPAAASATPTSATPAAGEPGSFVTAGDGTGGSGQPGERSSNVPGDETPSASPEAYVAVEGCDVPDVPAFTGPTAAFTTNAEVNFRSGPGTDCSPILEEPLGEGVAVTALGGPVTQRSDNSNWLQVEVDGVPGWVSLEFVEPAE